MTKTILFPISNAGGSIYLIKSFQKIGYRVVAGDATPFAIGRYIADAFYQLPWRNDPEYTNAILNIIQKENIDVYVTSGEQEALDVSRAREKYLQMGCTPTAANNKTMELAVDKCSLFDFLKKEVDIPLPLFQIVENIDDFEKGLEKLKGLRICMKPAVAAGSRGFVVVDEKPMDPNIIFNGRFTYPTVTPMYVRESMAKGAVPKMIMMEFLDEGTNLNAGIVGKNGELVYSSLHTREAVKDGLSTRGRILVNNEIVEFNRRIAKALDLTGYVVAQYIGNKIIEINPRWSTSIIHNSINEFMMGIQVWTGEPITIDPDDERTHQTLTYERYYETHIHDQEGREFD
jgi:carbamoylphosphate synthase large subunit